MAMAAALQKRNYLKILYNDVATHNNERSSKNMKMSAQYTKLQLAL